MNIKEKHYIKYITGLVLLLIIISTIFLILSKEDKMEKGLSLPIENVVISTPSPPPPIDLTKNKKVEEKDKAPTSQPTETSIPLKPRRDIKGRFLIEKLKKDLNYFNKDRLTELKRGLLSNPKTTPSDFALEFIKSDKTKVQDFGYELMTAICIERTEDFKPNEFFMAYAKKGISSSSYLSEIIEKTDDDFCREWACELSADIYFHNAPDDDPRKNKLNQFKAKEKKIYSFLGEALLNEKNIKEIEKKQGRLSDIIIAQWGEEDRIPLKVQALISTLDLMNTENISSCSLKSKKIIDTYNFNYNILGWINGKPIDRPNSPIEARLKKFSDAIFKDDHKDTYQWLPKENGGFTYEELEMAVKTRDRKNMKNMLAGFKKIIARILKQKILIGLGQNELKLLRHLNQVTWDNKPFDWDNRTITIKNPNNFIASLIMEKKDSGTPGVSFHIPERGEFVWNVPPGSYTISSKNSNIKNFPVQTLDIDKNNILINIDNH